MTDAYKGKTNMAQNIFIHGFTLTIECGEQHTLHLFKVSKRMEFFKTNTWM